MAVVIKLQRIGKRIQPHYRIVAIEKTSGPRAQPLEVIGHYNPKAEKDKDKVVINTEKLEYWQKNGAKPSETVKSLIKKVQEPAAVSEQTAPVQEEKK